MARRRSCPQKLEGLNSKHHDFDQHVSRVGYRIETEFKVREGGVEKYWSPSLDGHEKGNCEQGLVSAAVELLFCGKCRAFPPPRFRPRPTRAASAFASACRCQNIWQGWGEFPSVGALECASISPPASRPGVVRCACGSVTDHRGLPRFVPADGGVASVVLVSPRLDASPPLPPPASSFMGSKVPHNLWPL